MNLNVNHQMWLMATESGNAAASRACLIHHCFLPYNGGAPTPHRALHRPGPTAGLGAVSGLSVSYEASSTAYLSTVVVPVGHSPLGTELWTCLGLQMTEESWALVPNQPQSLCVTLGRSATLQ